MLPLTIRLNVFVKMVSVDQHVKVCLNQSCLNYSVSCVLVLDCFTINNFKVLLERITTIIIEFKVKMEMHPRFFAFNQVKYFADNPFGDLRPALFFLFITIINRVVFYNVIRMKIVKNQSINSARKLLFFVS